MGTLTTSGACIYKAGKNVSTDLTTSSAANTIWESFIDSATGQIEAATRVQWSAAYADVPKTTRKVLEETASCLAAIYGISYDMDAIGRGVAGDMINVLRDIALRNLKVLEDSKTKQFMGEE